MRYIVTGAVAALALAVTAGSASAQHNGGHNGGYNGGHSSYVAPRHVPAYAAPAHHSPGGHTVRPGLGFGYGPAYSPYTRPSYTPVYPVAPSYGHGHDRHDRGHH